jgi:hypothetical protein
MTQWLNEHAKAITSALVAGLIMFFTLRTNGMTSDEWATVVSAILAGGGLTWAVPNASPLDTTTTTNKFTSVTTNHAVESIQMTPSAGKHEADGE